VKSKYKVVSFIIIILVLAPIELRLFDITGQFILVNFKPVLLSPLIYFFATQKFHFRQFYLSNKFICWFYLIIIVYYLLQCLILNKINLYPLIIAKHFVYFFIWYYLWYEFKYLGNIKFIYQFYFVSFTAMILYLFYFYFNGEYFGFKDYYWYILSSVSVGLVVKKKYNLFKLIGWVILFLSLSRTAILSFLTSMLFKLNLRNLFYLFCTLFTVLLVVINLEIPQLDYYWDTILFFSDFKNISNMLSSDFNSVGSNFSNASDNFRTIELLRSIEIFKANPIFGVGFENYSSYASSFYFTDSLVRLPHNEFVRHLVEGGPFVFIFYLVLYISSFKVAVGNSTLPIYFSSFFMFLFTASNFLTLFLLILSRYYIPKASIINK